MLSDLYSFLRRCDLRHGQIAVLVVLSVGAVGFETLGLGLLMPIGQYLVDSGTPGDLAASSKFWSYASMVSDRLGIDIGIGEVAAVSVLAMVLRQAFTYFRLVYQAGVNHSLARNIRTALFEAFMRSDLGVMEREGSGQFTNTFTTEVNQVIASIALPIEILIAILLSVAYICLMTATAPYATLFLFGVGAVCAIGLRIVFRKMAQVSKRIVGANYALMHHIVERIQGARMIRLARMEAVEVDFVAEKTLEQKTANVQAMKLTALTEAGMEPIALIIGIPMLVVSVTVYNMELATVGFLLIVLARMMPMAKQAARAWQSMIRVYASMQAVRGTLDRLETMRENDGGDLSLDEPVESLRFDGVRFRYSPEEPEILQGIDLTLRRGEFVALVGPSGAGKSSLVDLIPRLRHPSAGTVQINGRSVDTYRLASLRDAIAYVGQTPVLISGSIRDQISYATVGASDDAIRRAAELAHAHDFITALPNGYDTVLGERGVGLSGGQRQRIELARALLRKAPVLVLDEPTSNVDAESEHKIRQALNEIHATTDTIILMIGHRLGNAVDADRVVVLNAGEIIQEGAFETLSKNDGWFANALHRQSASDETVTQEGVA